MIRLILHGSSWKEGSIVLTLSLLLCILFHDFYEENSLSVLPMYLEHYPYLLKKTMSNTLRYQLINIYFNIITLINRYLINLSQGMHNYLIQTKFLLTTSSGLHFNNIASSPFSSKSLCTLSLSSQSSVLNLSKVSSKGMT